MPKRDDASQRGPAELRPWRVLETHYSYEDKWLRLRTDRCERSDGHVIDTYHILEYPLWVNVVALTTEDQVVVVREYRHGAGKVLLGIPSGVARADETASDAAARELQEETGYTTAHLESLGTYFANPATQSNVVTSFLAVDATCTQEQRLDANEEIDSATLPFPEYLRRSWSHPQEFQGLHLAALYLAMGHILRSKERRMAGLRRRLLDFA